METLHTKIKVLFLTIIFLLPSLVYAEDNSLVVPAKKTQYEPNLPPLNEDGRRKPGAPVVVIIGDAGVIIPGVGKDEVSSYSIYDEDGLLAGLYLDDVEFAAVLLSMEGTVEIRIELADYALCGWAHL